jgi:hypothetical protein
MWTHFKMKYEAHAPVRNWRGRRKYCYEKNQGDLRVLHPFSVCWQRRATEQVSVIRHRVCNHCSVHYVNNRLIGRWTELESWRVYLFNKCESRHYVPLAVWNKVTMAATNLRRIVQIGAKSLGCMTETNVRELSKHQTSQEIPCKYSNSVC